MTTLRKSKRGALLFSLLFWTFAVVTSLILYPVAVLVRFATTLFDPRLTLLHRLTSFWGSLYTWCNPFWRVRIEGALPPDEPHVIVANHQSLADIFILFRLRYHYKWVSKAENFRIPLVGWNMSLNRYIKLERGTVRGNLKMMRDCERALNSGSSVMIFPEGTRSEDGSLRPFKDGAFELAIRTSSPILPVVIDGTAQVLPKRGFVIRGEQLMIVRILESIPANSFDGVTPQKLRDRLHDLISNELQAIRQSHL
jgi:1-acyl-sn-glycerol-3-phosphate acyltransferase